MEALVKDLIVGAASNGLWALAATTTTAAVQSLRDALSNNSEVQKAVQQGLVGVAAVYPLGTGLEKSRLLGFLKSPEIESVVRQIYATKVLHRGSAGEIAAIREEFVSLLSLHLDVAETEASPAASALFDAILVACNQNLAKAIEDNVLEAHEALSAMRHHRLSDELCAIHKNLALLCSTTKPNLSAFLEFEEKYRGQIRARHGFIQPPHFDSARKVPIDDLYVTPRFSSIPRNKQSEAQVVNLRSLLAAIHRTVIIGNPGGGKSTLAAKILHDLTTDYDQRMPVVGR